MRIRAAILIVVGTVSALSAQPPAFEVASVKPNRTAEPPRTYPRLQNGTFTAEKASLRTLLVIAFGLSELRINGPDWIDTERYDIAAKAPEGVPDNQIMPILQSLLKDRFHLESHFETREMPAFDMVVSKSGSKLRPFDPDHPPTPRSAGHGEALQVGVGTTAQIADALERPAGRPVVDKTGIEGRFGWMLLYNPFFGNANSADSDAPDIFAAVEQQLGLKLEPKKEPLQILVIDHLERIPTEN